MQYIVVGTNQKKEELQLELFGSKLGKAFDTYKGAETNLIKLKNKYRHVRFNILPIRASTVQIIGG